MWVKGWLLAKRSRRRGSVGQWSPFPLQVVTLFTGSPGWDSHMIDEGSKSESSKKQVIATVNGPGNYHCTTSTISYPSKLSQSLPKFKGRRKTLISLWEEGLRFYNHL